MTASILLVEDHPTFRAGFAHMLAGMGIACTLQEAPTLHAAFDALEPPAHFQLIVYDWSLPDGGGLGGLLALLQMAPRSAVAVLSGADEDAIEMAALRVGARAFIPKSAPLARLRQEIRALLDNPATGADAAPVPAATLVGRKLQVLRLMAGGQTNKQIAGALQIAESTVRDHVSDVLRALKARNRAEAVAVATQRGFIGGP